MFSKVLIANRGEIAVRVIRTCKELGIPTVAVYSELDTDALHVKMADEAFGLGGKTAAESYLNTDAITAIIQKSGADAVHPGYGFYSENADFARRLTEVGVTFIGPPPTAIEVMGDKISARKAAASAGVASVPGTVEPITSTEEVKAFGEEYGWPLAIKAAYGGGGRGMKMLSEGGDIEAAIESAKRESKAYFGREELYVERYLLWPRHVEIQLMADSHGNCVYLGSRDCSLQRRHQKLIEEAPAPKIEAEILKAMGEAGVAVAKECGYTNAGTAEFLYEDGEFYFLEMNTRLQVEHPATELVVGLDLVAEQLRVAAGEPLGYTQDDISISGHAIEVRINAEDPAGGAFLPAPGPIHKLKVPNGFSTRFDAGYEAGNQISEYYDNLVGKLICWGRDRDEAIRRTLRALEEMEIGPIPTTLAADIAMLKHEDFREVKHSTRWVSENLDLSHIPPNTAGANGQDKESQSLEVEVNGKRYSVTLWGDSLSTANTGGGSGNAATRARRQSSKATSSASQSTGGSTAMGPGEIVAPMQGTIVKILFEVGNEVQAGEPVVVLEAMKMENNVNSPSTGVLKEIKVEVGDTVGNGDILAVIE